MRSIEQIEEKQRHVQMVAASRLLYFFVNVVFVVFVVIDMATDPGTTIGRLFHAYWWKYLLSIACSWLAVVVVWTLLQLRTAR